MINKLKVDKSIVRRKDDIMEAYYVARVTMEGNFYSGVAKIQKIYDMDISDPYIGIKVSYLDSEQVHVIKLCMTGVSNLASKRLTFQDKKGCMKIDINLNFHLGNLPELTRYEKFYYLVNGKK